MLYERLFACRLALPPPGDALDRQQLPTCGGVCALTGENGVLVQLIGVQSLRRTLFARLTAPDEPGARRRADLRDVARHLWWQPTYSVFETAWVYLNIARQLLGKTYRKQLAFGPVWSACVQPDAAHPRWTVQAAPYAPGTIAAGPFATRKRAAAFVDGLVDIFDLCRDHDVLTQTPNGVRCAYYDMGKCPAPCDGTVAFDVYRRALAASIALATGGETDHLAHLDGEMRAAAARLDFEAAQRLKEKRQRTADLADGSERLGKTPEGLRYLILQRGRGRSFVRPFLFDGGCIAPLRETHREDLDAASASWLDGASSDNRIAVDAAFRTECLWLLGHFLAKGEGGSGLYFNLDGSQDGPSLAARVRAVFFSGSASNEME